MKFTLRKEVGRAREATPPGALLLRPAGDARAQAAARFDRVFAPDLDRRRKVMFIGKGSGDQVLALDWFAARGVACLAYDHLEHGLAVLQNRPEAWAYLFVDIDAAGALADVVGRLLRLRARVPSVPVVLLSHDFAVNDFGVERLTLADASLRLPMTRAGLEAAIEGAPRNNRLWQARSAPVPATAAH